MADDDQKIEFRVKEGGGADLVIDGEVHEVPLTERQTDILDELPPAESAPVDPEIQRLQAELEELEPFRPLIAAIGRKELIVQEAPSPEPVPPPAEDLAQYFARVQSPRGAAIHEQVKAYAEFLPESQRAALETIPSRYNEVFDKFAQATEPAPVKAGPDRREVERILSSREVRKDAARAEPAGLMRGNRASFPEVGPTGKEEEIARLKKAIKMHPNDQELARALASYYVGDL